MKFETPREQEREKKWENQQKIVESIRGTMGNPVGEPVKDSVIGLNIFGVNTIFSGEGRMEDSLRATAPFVDIESPEIKKINEEYTKRNDGLGFNEAEADYLLPEVLRKNLEETAKLIPLLEEFYNDRKVSFDARLIIESWEHNRGHITNQGARLQELLDKNARKQKLAEYQNEMRAFGKFLKNKYLTE